MLAASHFFRWFCGQQADSHFTPPHDRVSDTTMLYFVRARVSKNSRRVSQKLARNNGRLVTPLLHGFSHFTQICQGVLLANLHFWQQLTFSLFKFWQLTFSHFSFWLLPFSLFTPPVASRLSRPETKERESFSKM